MEIAEMLKLYQQMVTIRRMEERCSELYTQGKIGGFLHLYIGEEAVAVGAISARGPHDNVITAYRDHGVAVACGMEPKVAIAEMLGKATGCCKGKGGSMHLADIRLRYWGGHAIVGAHLPLATGLALADKYHGSSAVTFCFFGDGATNIGYFHEAVNLAVVWKLPILFICENNQYGMGTTIERASAVSEMFQKACSYDMAAAQVDGMCLPDVRAAVEIALAHVRAGRGPYFLEAKTYRYRGHSMGDPERYRKREEVKEQQLDDPIKNLGQILVAQGVPESDLEAYDAAARVVIDEAVAFAEASPLPAPEELWKDIYVDN
jgi:pyruvate dehydrogenase E1 component alpha subunit